MRNNQYRDSEDIHVEPPDEHLHIRNASLSSENGYPIPVWMRESAKSFRCKWIPTPLRQAGRTIARWIKGPIPPLELRVKPIYPEIQEAPLRWMDNYLPRQRHRIFLLIAFYGIWFLTWSLMLRHNLTAGYIEGYGKPSNIWCGASFWNDGNGCGQDGNGCRPFSSTHLAFRCPANCQATQLLEPRVVGNHSYVYQGLVIGGPNPDSPDGLPIYRGDSFICQAAIHAGVISDNVGGCGVATLTGTHTNFHASESNGVRSISFPSSFPRTFTFQSLSHTQARCPTDSRWPLFAVTAIALVLLWFFTASPSTLFLSTFFILTLHVGLVSDPPGSSNFHELLSSFFARLLPASFIVFVLCRYCAIPTLSGLTAQIEKPILYLTFTFFGALNNYTFSRLIPIQRLTPQDVKNQPGAPVALSIIVVCIITIVVMQIYHLRISGQLPRYLKIYALFLLGLLVLLVLPGWRLRIHHYILAMLFMPGTALQTRPSMIYQGLLLGLFINGVMRWGFASVIQTPDALGEVGGGHGGTWWGASWPVVNATVLDPDRNHIRFEWGDLPRSTGVDGVSILIDDVERWRGYIDEELYWRPSGVTLERRGERRTSAGISLGARSSGEKSFRGMRSRGTDHHHNNNDTDREVPPWPEPDFYRFAWMNGNDAGTYGNVGVWDEWGRWWPPRAPV